MPSISVMCLTFYCRRLLQVVSYFIFFYNVMFGAVMCFLRALGVVMFTMVASFRLDKDVYMRGMEGWDLGKWSTRLMGNTNVWVQ